MGKKMKNQAPVELGQEVSLWIDGLGSNGEGVGRVDNYTVFVLYALPGEEVRVIIETVKKTYSIGRLTKLLQASPERQEAPCELYGICGGCQLQHTTYENQLALKTQKVKDIMVRIGGLEENLVLPALGPKNPWAYRNKMQMPVGGIRGHLRMGFYKRGSHAIVDGTNCLIQRPENNEIAKVCYDLAHDLGVEPYDEKTGKGFLRHVIGRVGQDQWMVILVGTNPNLPRQEEWIHGIRQALPKVSSIVLNINDRKTNVIMGPKNRLLWGETYMQDTIEDLTFSLSPHSFFQVNPEQTAVLYNKALEFADLSGGESVIDAYCGTGTISLFLAHKAKRVIGIEIVEPAILDARKNAAANGFFNTEFIVGDAAIEMPKLYKKGERPDVIVFDPIRAGCKEEVLIAAAGMKPKRMVYVSCNPASMARDIGILRPLGYEVVKVQPVDMFPQTSHVEAVALLIQSPSDAE